MRFHPRRTEEPEINLIPFIDVLLVILIFLMLSTTYSKFTEMQLRLPTADANAPRDYPKEVIVAISVDGRYSINRSPVAGRGVEAVQAALDAAAAGRKDSMVIISADAASPHQATITVLEAARRGGFSQITFAAQRPAGARP
ncbi:MAG: biopolymer transporter ExbD [Ramlibacter sp.]|jgi:biopolymer transport protein ExbD|uniref:ExbD/TolR family protein n=1 Tax=Ramlibacter sp. TaxID=1917967 RepID=UPI00260DF8AE|nr:biopolymer transporter ExbD [Ramlibacter sp.]MDH4378214.1 biopolymer transporter ExbD [Ramlibacter sp.]